MKKLLIILSACLFLAPVAFAQDFITLLRTGTPEQLQAAIAGGAKVNDKIGGSGDDTLDDRSTEKSEPRGHHDLVEGRGGIERRVRCSRNALDVCGSEPESRSHLRPLEGRGEGPPEDPPGMAAVWTALMWSAGYNPNPEVITTLLKAGGRIEERDGDSYTPLMYAARYNANPGNNHALGEGRGQN